MKNILALPLLLLLVLTACKNKISLNEDGVPSTLLIGVFSGDEPDNAIKKLDRIGKYMEKKLGMKVEYIQTSDYTAVIEALRSKKVHIAHLSPFSYVLASERVELVPLVGVGINGEPKSYRSLIVTSHRTGLKTMEDVKRRAKDLTLSFSDPASASGHLIPRAYLNSEGLDPQSSFKQVLFASSNGASVLTAHAGKVDIACTYENAIPILLSKKMIKEDEIVVLWQSEPIVTSPIVVRRDVNDAFKEKVKQAYIDLPKEEPEIYQDYIRLYYKNDITGFGYVPLYDSMFDGLREIAKGVTDVNALQ